MLSKEDEFGKYQKNGVVAPELQVFHPVDDLAAALLDLSTRTSVPDPLKSYVPFQQPNFNKKLLKHIKISLEDELSLTRRVNLNNVIEKVRARFPGYFPAQAAPSFENWMSELNFAITNNNWGKI